MSHTPEAFLGQFDSDRVQPAPQRTTPCGISGNFFTNSSLFTNTSPDESGEVSILINLPGDNNLIHKTVFFCFFRVHKVIALRIPLHFLVGFPCILCKNPVHFFFGPH